MRRGRESRSSMREGIWNWGGGGGGAAGGGGGGGKKKAKTEEKQRLRRFSLCEGKEGEKGVRVRMNSASEVEFCLARASTNASASTRTNTRTSTRASTTTNASVSAREVEFCLAAHHQAYAVVHKEREGVTKAREKGRDRRAKEKENASVEGELCDCDENGRGEERVGRRRRGGKERERSGKPAETDFGECDCSEDEGSREHGKPKEQKSRERNGDDYYYGRGAMVDEVCDCISGEGGKDNEGGGHDRLLDDVCDCEVEVVEEKEEEEEEQSEAYRSLPEVQEDFGIVRKSGRKFENRQMVEKRSQRNRKAEKGAMMASENIKSKDKRAFEDETRRKSLEESGKTGRRSEYAADRNEKQTGDVPDAKEGTKRGSIQEERISGEGAISCMPSEGVISSLPHPIRHFERSDHLCRDVQRLRK